LLEVNLILSRASILSNSSSNSLKGVLKKSFCSLSSKGEGWGEVHFPFSLFQNFLSTNSFQYEFTFCPTKVISLAQFLTTSLASATISSIFLELSFHLVYGTIQ
jgi:hypothetical protein